MKNANIPDGGDNPFKGGTTYKSSYHWKKGEENWGKLDMIVDKKYISYSEQFVVHWVSQRIDEKCGSDSRLSVNIQLDFEQVLF